MSLQYNIPDLSALRTFRVSFAAEKIFSSDRDYETYALLMNLMRLMDLAIREYESGRRVLDEFKTRSGSIMLSPIFLASGHFEECASTLKRLINYVKVIRSHPKVPEHLKTLLPGKLTVLRGQVEKQITDMRDAIQHLENRIYKGEITPGDAICLEPSQHGLNLGKHKVLYADLAGWLQELHSHAEKLL